MKPIDLIYPLAALKPSCSQMLRVFVLLLVWVDATVVAVAKPLGNPIVRDASRGVVELLRLRVVATEAEGEDDSSIAKPDGRDVGVRVGYATVIGKNRFASALSLLDSKGVVSSGDTLAIRDVRGRIYPLKMVDGFHEALSVFTFSVEAKPYPRKLRKFRLASLDWARLKVGSRVCFAVREKAEFPVLQCQGLIKKIAPKKPSSLGYDLEIADASASPVRALGGPVLNTAGEMVGMIVDHSGGVVRAVAGLDLAKVSQKVGLAFEPRIGFFIEGQMRMRPGFYFKFPLPGSLDEVRARYQKMRSKKYVEAFAQYKKAFAQEMFPASRESRRAIEQALIPNFFGALEHDGSGKAWVVNEPQKAQLMISSRQFMQVAKTSLERFVGVHVEKDSEMSLAQFLKRPKSIYDHAVTGVGAVWGARIELASELEDGLKPVTFRDRLGRTWNSYVVKDRGRLTWFYYSPSLTGAFVLLRSEALEKSAPIGIGVLEDQLFMDRFLAHYIGPAASLGEFLKLEDRPTSFEQASAQFAVDRFRLQVADLAFAARFAIPHSYDQLQVRLSYDPRGLAVPTILGISFKPNYRETDMVGMSRYFVQRSPRNRFVGQGILKADLGRAGFPFDNTLRQSEFGYEQHLILADGTSDVAWVADCVGLSPDQVRASCRMLQSVQFR